MVLTLEKCRKAVFHNVFPCFVASVFASVSRVETEAQNTGKMRPWGVLLQHRGQKAEEGTCAAPCNDPGTFSAPEVQNKLVLMQRQAAKFKNKGNNPAFEH